jgi:hypothetical protein
MCFLPGRLCRGYVLLSLVGLFFASACTAGNGACLFAAIWGMTGCMPWPRILDGYFGIGPNSFSTTSAIAITSGINAVLLYVIGVWRRRATKTRGGGERVA